MSDDLKSSVLAIKDDLISWRRDFHQHPELGLEVFRTAEIVAGHLNRLGLDVTTGVGETGVVGIMEGSGPGDTLMLRADMDALAIQEAGELPFRSQNDGAMHACAHDGHTAILMGVAQILAKRRSSFPGRIKFVFQPGEEGAGGGRLMNEAGVMENPKVDAAFALHIWGYQPVGTVGVREGPVMAGADVFWVKILGEGGHAAHPENGVDAIMIAGQLIVSLQTLVSREVAAQDPVVAHIGLLSSGDTAGNAIADEVTMRLSVRTLNPETGKTIPEKVERIVGGIVSAFRGRFEIEHAGGLGGVTNDPVMTGIAREAAIKAVGLENVIIPEPTMGSEDMAVFMNQAPGCYIFIGGQSRDNLKPYAHHHPLFEFDEEALVVGTETMAGAAVSYLNS